MRLGTSESKEATGSQGIELQVDSKNPQQGLGSFWERHLVHAVPLPSFSLAPTLSSLWAGPCRCYDTIPPGLVSLAPSSKVWPLRSEASTVCPSGPCLGFPSPAAWMTQD